MKKLLLGTSVLAAVAFAAAAQANTPKITVGGTSDVQYGRFSNKEVTDTFQRKHEMRTDNEVSFKVDGKSSFGLGYGGEIVLEADTTNDADSQGTNAARTLLYVDGGWGRVEAGSTTGAAANMKVDAARIARATGGIDGDWTYYVGANGSQTFIATPDLVTDYGGVGNAFGSESLENLNKISYYTPKFSGFQAGFTYIPDMENRGQGASGLDNTKNTSLAANVYEAALSYEGKFDEVGVGAAFTYQGGSAEGITVEDLSAWNAGAKLSYLGFSVAGSYGDWGDSLRTLNGNLDDNDYWTVGGAYEFGPYAASVTYLKSNYSRTSTSENNFTNLSIGADYKLAPGLTPYAEVSFYDADSALGNGKQGDNEGSVLLVGTMLNF